MHFGPTTPAAAGLRMPAEWAPHECCLVAWPVRRSLWGGEMAAAEAEYAAAIRTIAGFEAVLVVSPVAEGRRVADLTGVEVVEMPIDDSWVRDTGPIFVTGPGERAAVDFRFNSWGGKYLPYEDDALLAARLCAHLGVPRYAARFVLEGGAITVDGEGTLVTTEQCLLNPNRNPDMSRADVEAGLRAYLGAEEIVWLPHGLVEDRDTDGHVDNVAAFVAPRTVLAQTVSDPRNPNYARLRENLAVLARSVDARGRPLEVHEVDVLPYADVAGATVAVPYVNLYLADGAAVVPVTGHAADDDVLGRLAEILPDREVVATPGRTLAHGGGGVHCVTQQVPPRGGGGGAPPRAPPRAPPPPPPREGAAPPGRPRAHGGGGVHGVTQPAPPRGGDPVPPANPPPGGATC